MLKAAKKIWQNEFFQGGIFYTTSSFFNHLMNYLFNFLAGRTLGPKGYAEIAALFSYTTIALVPTVVFSTFLIQKISASSLNQKIYSRSLERLFLNKIKKWWYLFVIPIIFAPLLPKFTNLTPLVAWSLYPLLYFAYLSSFYGSAIQGLKLFLAVSLIGILVTFLKLIGAWLVYLGLDGIATIIFFLIMSNFFLFYLSKRVVTGHLKKNMIINSKILEKRTLQLLTSRQFVIIFVSTLALTLLNNLDVVIVKKFFLATDAGIYSSWSLSAKIILYFVGPLISISFVFISGSKNEAIKNKTLLYSLIILFFVGIISFAFYKNFASFIIGFFFGNKFEAVTPYLASASIFGSFYTALTFFNSFYLAKNSSLALILPIFLPIYIVLLYLIPKKLSAVITLNIFFSATLVLAYLILYLFSKIRYSKITDGSTQRMESLETNINY